MSEQKDKPSRPLSNVAQIAAAIIGLLTLLFGSNIIGSQCSKQVEGRQMAQQVLESNKGESEEIKIDYNDPIFSSDVLYEYKVRNSEIEPELWNYLETLVAKKDYNHAIVAIDSLIQIEIDNVSTRNILIDCKNGIQLMSDKNFETANWNGITNIVTVSLKDKIGIYDTDRKEIFSPQFDDVLIANRNLFLVKKGERWGFVNRKKSFMIYPKYDDVFDVYLPFTVVKIEERFGLVNYQGKEICRPEYDDVKLLKNGIIVLKSKGKYEMIDTNGLRILKEKFDFIETDSSQDMLQLFKGDDEYLFYSSSRKLEKRN